MRPSFGAAERGALAQPFAAAQKKTAELRARRAGEVTTPARPAPFFDADSSILSVPLPEDLAPGDVVEIRVASPDGAREIRQRLEVGSGETRVEIRLPRSWLGSGTCRVERRIRGADASIERTSEFRVPIP
jgi:hypothetical protein